MCMDGTPYLKRRCFKMSLHLRGLFLGLVLSVFILSFSIPCLGEPAEERKLTLYNLHTHERLEIIYKKGDQYIHQALQEISFIMLDNRTGKIHPIDPKLLDFLFDLLAEVKYKGDVHIVSGYRSPETNNRLRKGDPGIANGSLHMQGKALDFRLPGVDTRMLRDKALATKRGGVGYYKRQDFIHIDMGRVRFW